jgi:hypothetical protein
VDKDTQDYFDRYFDLFASQGWKQFIEDMEDNRTLMSDLLTIKDANDLYYRKGQLEVLNRIVNFQLAIENAYKEVTDEENV